MTTPSTIPVQADKQVAYVRLKALIWTDFGLEFPENLRSQTGRRIESIWRENSASRPLVLNCQGVSIVDQHALEEVRRHAANASQPLVFVSSSSTFLEDLEHALGKPTLSFSVGVTAETTAYAYAQKSPNREVLRPIIQHAYQLESTETQSVIAGCFEQHADNALIRLHSTPILASGIFNARVLIGDPRKFCLISLQLAERLEALLERNRPANPCVLAVSLRGSPIAAAAAFLASPRLDVEVIDHMGPKQALLEGYSFKRTRAGISYIYIGDFLIGGTELKVASSYACALGCRVTHALTIGSLLRPEDYCLSIPMESLVRLSECRNDVRYQFTF